MRTVIATIQDARLEPRGIPRLEPASLHRPARLRCGAHPHLDRSHGAAGCHPGESELPRHGQARAATGAVAGPGGDIPLHSGRRQAVHHLGAAAHPVLYPQRRRTGIAPGAQPRPFDFMSMPDLLAALAGLPVTEKLLVLAGAVFASTAVFSATHWLLLRFIPRTLATLSLRHAQYEVTLRDDGAVCSRAPGRDYDLSRRSYDLLDPAGRALFVVDAADVPGRPPLAWPVIGNFPGERGIPFSLEQDGQVLKVSSTSHGIRTGIEICTARARRSRRSSGRSRSRTCRTGRDRSRSCRTWNGSSTTRRPTGGTLSTTGCSPRWSIRATCTPSWPGTSTRRPWASSPRIALPKGS